MKTSAKRPVITLLIGGLGLIARLAAAIAPTIDYSHNMRILKLPQSTPVGSLVYRLKGSDGDANSQLVFGLAGHEARALLDVVPVQRSWNEADVYLRSKLEKSHYNFTLSVTDGNKTTQVESTILVTQFDPNNDDQQQQQQQIVQQSSGNASSPTTGSSLPFLNTKHVFHVPENAKPNELIGSVSVLESEKSDLPVRFELRGRGAERFSISYVFGPKGQSRGEIVLSQEVDYEKQNLFALKVLALNAWTDSRYDTRNVASMDIVVAVADVQDSPPVFRNLPHSIRLPTDLRAGQLIYKCEAEDGDFADQRPVQYALDAGSPLASYFDIDKTGGEIRLVKPIAELLMHAAWQQQPSMAMLTVFASELPDPSSYDHLWPPMYARVEIPLLLVDTRNEPPQFVGGWQTREPGQTRAGRQVNTLHGYLPEWQQAGDSGQSQQQQLVVRWFTNSSGNPTDGGGGVASNPLDGISKSLGNRPSVLDLGLGSNGTFELSLEGADAELFHLDPSGFPISRQSTFTLSVADGANRSLFDHEHNNKLSHLFTVDVVARDFGQPERLSSRIRCLIELVDANDNWPRFETDLYSFSVYENAPIGYVLGQVRARDSDSAGKVSYVSLAGLDSQLFRLNQDSGQVTLEAHLDRERKSLYMFLVEARDSASERGLSNYTQMVVAVLDVNDNAPVFLQAHYDAVLQPDGTFYQPLQVKAIDADEPGAANSQVAYEIIAGNLNEQFAIDSVSGVIYPVAGGGKQYPPAPPLPALGPPAELPSTLREPISPHRTSSGGQLGQAGKIRPTLEVEDSPRASRRLLQQHLDRQLEQPPNQRPEVPALDMEQLPALDLLMSLESAAGAADQLRPQADISLASAAKARGGGGGGQLGQPITTLVVRAHDFGIPLRSSTVRVNIFNQALLTRSVSLILNGTVEQLDSRREAIERAFSSLTGSRATIESLDALSDSSSLSVARVRLALPEHSLVDLTDLSALVSAIEHRSHSAGASDAQQQRQQATHVPGGGNLYYSAASSNLSSSSNGSGGANAHLGHNIFSDIHSYAIDSNAALERRLLIYIIIVGVCILALLVAWMIYYCCSRNEQKSQKLIGSSSSRSQLEPAAATYRPTTAAAADAANKTHAKMAATPTAAQSNHHGAGSPIANNLAKSRAQLDDHSMSNLLQAPMLAPAGGGGGGSTMDANQITTTALNGLKPNNYSMYNGQVWFEPNNSLNFRQNQSIASGADIRPYQMQGRRASSAPSGGGNSLESALRSVMGVGSRRGHPGGATWAAGPRNGAGQFFPNSLGYTQNVASMAANQPDAYSRTSGGRPPPQQQQHRRGHHRSSKVAPMPDNHGHSNGAFVDDNNETDLEAGGSTSRRHPNAAGSHRKQSSLDSTGSTATATGDNCSTDGVSIEAPASSSMAAAEMSVELDSDQELLGFDSTGTPIIATHTRSTSIKPLVWEGDGRPSASSVSQQLNKSRETPIDAKTQKLDGAAGEQTLANSAPIIQEKSEIRQTQDEDRDRGEQEQEQDKQKREETSTRQQAEGTTSGGGGGSKSTNGGKNPQMSSAATSPLMSELTERISSRKGSADKHAEHAAAVASAGRSGGEEPAAGPLASSTSASNKRQLMLRQQGKTSVSATKSLSRTRTRTRTQTQTQTTEDGSADERSNADTVSISSRARELASMKNGELLEKKSIFALTYSGLATDKLPD